MRTHEYCEFCGEEKEAEFVDIGIGFQQVTESRCPFGCREEKEEFSCGELERLKVLTVKELAMRLEQHLLHEGSIREDMTVHEYLKLLLK